MDISPLCGIACVFRREVEREGDTARQIIHKRGEKKKSVFVKHVTDARESETLYPQQYISNANKLASHATATFIPFDLLSVFLFPILQVSLISF